MPSMRYGKIKTQKKNIRELAMCNKKNYAICILCDIIYVYKLEVRIS